MGFVMALQNSFLFCCSIQAFKSISHSSAGFGTHVVIYLPDNMKLKHIFIHYRHDKCTYVTIFVLQVNTRLRFRSYSLTILFYLKFTMYIWTTYCCSLQDQHKSFVNTASENPLASGIAKSYLFFILRFYDLALWWNARSPCCVDLSTSWHRTLSWAEYIVPLACWEHFHYLCVS